MGAWIETPKEATDIINAMTSLPAWERGLKLPVLVQDYARDVVAPCIGGVD